MKHESHASLEFTLRFADNVSEITIIQLERLRLSRE